jgi:hypothetical protein
MEDRDRNRTLARMRRPDRAERLAAALRANLKRRKAQARGRADSAEAADAEDVKKGQNRPSSGENDE